MLQRAAPTIDPVATPVDLRALVEAYPDRWRFLLHSAGEGRTRSSRWSIAFRQTGEALSAPFADRHRFFAQLNTRLGANPPAPSDAELPFLGGWFVYLGYEMASAVEPTLTVPAPPDAIPTAFAAECGCAVLFDHHLNRCWLVSESADWQRQAQAEVDALSPTDLEADAKIAVDSLQWRVSVDPPERFVEGVRAIQAYIDAGDVFQVNLSREWRLSSQGEMAPMALFDALMVSNPSPFSGLAHLPGGTVISTSPERLIERRKDKIQTRPIAGTRPRGASIAKDLALVEELTGNLKERAEHVMLIDLERNDLGRVCRPGTVAVDELMGVESYAHVHHIVSNVTGQLKSSASSIDALCAVFPGGTITGCPKVRCMEIIAELEGVGRGAYTGAMGYIDCHDNMDMNILIRSACLTDQGVRFRTGAGIVADSDPWAELRETEAKAKGLLSAFGVVA